MNLDIIEEKQNKILHRTEIRARVTFDSATPSREEIIKLISAKKNVPENLVIVREINQKFGQRAADVEIMIYESRHVLEDIESKYRLKRQEKKEQKEGEE